MPAWIYPLAKSPLPQQSGADAHCSLSQFHQLLHGGSITAVFVSWQHPPGVKWVLTHPGLRRFCHRPFSSRVKEGSQRTSDKGLQALTSLARNDPGHTFAQVASGLVSVNTVRKPKNELNKEDSGAMQTRRPSPEAFRVLASPASPGRTGSSFSPHPDPVPRPKVVFLPRDPQWAYVYLERSPTVIVARRCPRSQPAFVCGSPDGQTGTFRRRHPQPTPAGGAPVPQPCPELVPSLFR